MRLDVCVRIALCWGMRLWCVVLNMLSYWNRWMNWAERAYCQTIICRLAAASWLFGEVVFFSAAAMNRVSKLFLPLIYKPQSGEYKKDLSSKAHRVSEWRYGSADWWPHSIDSDDYTPNLWVVDAGAGTNQINIIWWLLLLDADASKIPREMHQFNRSLHGVCRWSKDDHTDVDGDKFAEKIWLVVRHRHWVNRPMAPM